MRMERIGGVRKPIAELAQQCGIPHRLLHERLLNDWSLERAMTTPARARKKRFEFRGQLLSAMEIGKLLGISASSVHHRARRGVPLDRPVQPGYRSDLMKQQDTSCSNESFDTKGNP